ncbi:MAG: type II RES/Xre toxin-antitoxin system antitoxin [Opitutaceae bacterium]
MLRLASFVVRVSFASLVLAFAPARAAAPAARPNILFVIADDQSWAHTSFAGDPVIKTPHFDRVAREGVYFPHAFCSSPSCTPSRGAILTGQAFCRLEGRRQPARHERFLRREVARFTARSPGQLDSGLTGRHLAQSLRQMTRPLFEPYPLHDNLKMAQLVAAGLPASSVKRLGVALGMRPANVGPLVNITRKTIERRMKRGARLKPNESDRVARLMRVVARAAGVLESDDNARQWLRRPLKVLGGKTPLELTVTEPGAREVEQVLGRLEHGVFA